MHCQVTPAATMLEGDALSVFRAQAASQQAHSDQQLMGMLDHHAAGGSALPSVQHDGLSIVVPAALEPLVASQHDVLDGQLSPVVQLHGFTGHHPAQSLLPASQVSCLEMATSIALLLLPLCCHMLLASVRSRVEIPGAFGAQAM